MKLPGLLNWVNLNYTLLNPGDLDYLKERTAFAQSSYCLEGLQEWKCVKCRPELQVKDIKFAGMFESTVFAYSGYSAPLNTIVVAFRGTRTLNGWIRDIRFAKPDCSFPDAPLGAKVHLGFLEAWTYLKPEIMENLDQLIIKYPKSKLLVTGHSLGGAVSSISTADLYSSKYSKKFVSWTVITFGQPRGCNQWLILVGNDIFAKWVSGFKGVEYFRIVNENDVVAHRNALFNIVPPHWADFQHIPKEIWIKQNETYYCPMNENGDESLDCSNQFRFFSVYAHTKVWDDDFIGIEGCILPLLKVT